MMRALLAMIKANLKMNVRNRQALFWNLAFPLIFIVLFGAIFSGSSSINITVGVAGDSSALQTQTLGALNSSDAFKVHSGSTDAELKALNDGKRDVVLVFGPAPADGGQPQVTMMYDDTNGTNAQIAMSAVRQVLLQVSQGSNPVQVVEQPVTTHNLSYIDFFVPGILGMSLMNSGVIGLSTAFVTYRERGILRRVKVTPFPLTNFILARVISQLLIAVAQAVILTAVGMAFFNLHLNGNLVLALLMIVVGSLAFLAIGFAISGFAKNAEAAASYANLITFPMLFLSGVFFSIDSGPSWLQPIAKVLPLTYLVNGLRDVMTRGQGVSAIWVDLIVLLGFFAAAMIFAVRFFKWEARPA
jgi:ABC-2 type transport system permease protein